MELGLHITRFDWTDDPREIGPGLSRIARAADDAGLVHLSAMDHYFQIGVVGPPEDPMLEGYLVALHLAHSSSRARVGVLATGSQYRHPGLLVKLVTTLDVLSGGRALCILGAGWNEHESRGLGVPMPTMAERFDRLEDTVRLARQMFAGDETPFEGAVVHAERPINHPLPLSAPRPPIMIGGGGERRTLRLVAQYADACNVFVGPGSTPQERMALPAGKFAVLRAHCEELGRPYDEIRRTALISLPMSAGMPSDEVLALCRAATDAGVQELIVMLDDPSDLRCYDLLGNDVVPVVAGW